MNPITNNLSNATNGSSFKFLSQNPIEAANRSLAEKPQSDINLKPQNYIKTTVTNLNLARIGAATTNINNATTLVQSVDAAAAIIESKLIEMQNIAANEGGCGCQTIKKVQESIADVSNGFSWKGENFMIGGGENNQQTTPRSLTVNTFDETRDDLRLSFKSFNPMSAVDTDGSLEPITPNLPDLNKLSGTDTHAYGNAAMYSGLNTDAYLHTHTRAMREHAILQIGRAIEGVKDERERLVGYLKELNNVSESNQGQLLNRSKNANQWIDSKTADQIAVSLKEEILRNPEGSQTTLLKTWSSDLNQLLN